MSLKKLGAAAALACACAPAAASDLARAETRTMVFILLPLDGAAARDRLPSWGLSLHGRREHERFTLDSRAMSRFTHLGFIESKAVLVGAIAAMGVLAVAASGGGSSGSPQPQASAPPAAQPQSPAAAPCPKRPAC